MLIATEMYRMVRIDTKKKKSAGGKYFNHHLTRETCVCVSYETLPLDLWVSKSLSLLNISAAARASAHGSVRKLMRESGGF